MENGPDKRTEDSIYPTISVFFLSTSTSPSAGDAHIPQDVQLMGQDVCQTPRDCTGTPKRTTQIFRKAAKQKTRS